jgi:hypothetical protein
MTAWPRPASQNVILSGAGEKRRRSRKICLERGPRPSRGIYGPDDRSARHDKRTRSMVNNLDLNEIGRVTREDHRNEQ